MWIPYRSSDCSLKPLDVTRNDAIIQSINNAPGKQMTQALILQANYQSHYAMLAAFRDALDFSELATRRSWR
jgi:hypothetical protein